MLLTTLLLLCQAPTVHELRAERYVVDPAASEVGFHGSSDLHDFTGRSKRVSGEMLVDLEALGTLAGGAFRVQAKSLDTDNSSRDKKMRKTLDVDRYPEIVFELGRASGALPPEGGKVSVDGAFVIHGVRRERSFQLDVRPRDDGALRVRGKTRFEMTDHGIEPPSVLFIDVAEEVEVYVDLLLRPADAPPLDAQRVALTVVDGSGASHEERLWLRPDALLWERPARGTWVLGRAGTAESFRFGAPLDRTAHATLARTAPAGAPSVQRDEGSLRVAWEGEPWLELEGLRGDAPFGALLARVDGLPPAVQSELEATRGLPVRWRLRTLRGEVLEATLGEPAAGALPAWALDADVLRRSASARDGDERGSAEPAGIERVER